MHLHSRGVKQVSVDRVDTLVERFQNSVNSRRVAEGWKTASGTVQKGRKAEDGELPAGLFNICCWQDARVKEELTGYLVKPYNQTRSKHCFMKVKVCLTNVLKFSESVTGRVREEPVDVVYLDLQKVFDKVPCRWLVYTLKLQVSEEVCSHG